MPFLGVSVTDATVIPRTPTCLRLRAKLGGWPRGSPRSGGGHDDPPVRHFAFVLTCAASARVRPRGRPRQRQAVRPRLARPRAIRTSRSTATAATTSALRPRPRLRPGDRRPSGRRDDHGQGDAEPVELQPRPQRHDRALGHGRRRAGHLDPRRRRADHHAEARPAPSTARFTTVDRLRRRAGADRRRRSSGSRASSTPTTARSSPASPTWPRPGTRSTTTRSTRRPTRSAITSRAGLQAIANGELKASRAATARRPGSGTRRSRWRPTSPRRPSASST